MKRKIWNLSSAYVVHTTTKHYFRCLMRKRTIATCTKMENARAKCSKLLFSIVEYPNLWRSCPPCPSGCLSSQVVITTVTWDGVRGEHFSHVCSECSLWNLFAGDYLSQQLSCAAFLAVFFTNDDFSKLKQKVVIITVTRDRVRSEDFRHVCAECSLWNLFAGDYLSQRLTYVAFLAVCLTNDDFSKFKQKVEEMLDSLITCLLCGRKAITVSMEF